MSELSDHVEKLVLDALSDALPGPVTGFVGIASYLDDDGDPKFALFDMPGSHLGENLGMARAVGIFYEGLLEDALFGEDG
jgi:hypothetical protein